MVRSVDFGKGEGGWPLLENGYVTPSLSHSSCCVLRELAIFERLVDIRKILAHNQESTTTAVGFSFHFYHICFHFSTIPYFYTIFVCEDFSVFMFVVRAVYSFAFPGDFISLNIRFLARAYCVFNVFHK